MDKRLKELVQNEEYVKYITLIARLSQQIVKERISLGFVDVEQELSAAKRFGELQLEAIYDLLNTQLAESAELDSTDSAKEKRVLIEKALRVTVVVRTFDIVADPNKDNLDKDMEELTHSPYFNAKYIMLSIPQATARIVTSRTNSDY